MCIPNNPNFPFLRQQVALQVSLPEIDGAIEPLIFSGRDGTSGRSIPMQERMGLTQVSEPSETHQ